MLENEDKTFHSFGSINKIISNKHTPYLLIFLFSLVYFYPYLFDGKVMLPFQILSGNPAVIQESWIENAPKGQNGVGYDLLTQFYPWKTTIKRSFREQYLPLWNSFNQAGTPFIANIQVGYFYIANILLLFFTTPTAITLIAIFNILVAAFGTYFYLRVLGVAPVWGCLGAIGFIQSAYLVHWFQWIPHTGAMAWFPWMLSFMHLAIQRWNIRWLICAQIVSSLAILSGHIQFAYYGLIAITLYAVLMVVVGLPEGALSLQRRLTRAISYLIIFAVGIAVLTALQLWPSWELTQHCLRGKEDIHSLLATTFNFIQVLQLWSRVFLGAFDSVNGWGGYSIGLDNPYVPLFLSGVVFSTFFSSIIYKRHLLPLLSIMILAFGVVFGEKHIFTVIGKVPLFDHFRAPSRFGFIGSFTVVCFSILFLSDLSQRLQNNGRMGLIKSFPYALTAIIFVSSATIFWWKHQSHAPHRHVLDQILFVVLFLSLYQTSLYMVRKKHILIIWPLILIALGSFEAILSNSNFNPKMTKPNSGIIQLTPALAELGKDEGIRGRLIRVSKEEFEPLFAPVNLNLLHNIPDIHGYSTFIRKEYADFFEGIDNKSFSSIAKGWNQIRNFKPKELESASLRLLGVRFVLSNISLPSKYQLIGNVGSALLYELPNTLPRLFLLPLNTRADSFKDHKEVLKQATELLGSYEVQIIKIPNGYHAELNTNCKAQVVLGELYYQGWRAWIDENEVPVYSIAHGLIATHVEPGKHHVRLEYRPKSFILALAVSILSWVMAIGYLAVGNLFEKKDIRKQPFS